MLRTLLAVALASSSGGPLMFIGGGKDQDDLMKRFFELSGGDDAPVVVFPLASDDPVRSGKAYVAYFAQLGHPKASYLVPKGEPAAAELAVLAKAGGLFWSGGDQARIVKALTPGWRTAIAGAWQRGAAIAGTSAGAMVWGASAIMDGDPMETGWYGEDPKHQGIRLGSGLGVAPGFVVDTHFSQRGRVPRLAYAVAKRPGTRGIGVDPETAAIVKPDGEVEVQGRGTVTLIQVPPQAVKSPLSLKNLRVDLLSAGDTHKW